jgi:hypothetical protein
MSQRQPSPAIRRSLPRRIIQLASLGLAGLLAGLLTGCTSSTAARLLNPPNDTDWQTSSTYASATSSLPPASVSRAAHARGCYTAPCALRTETNRPHLSHHRSM